MPSRCVVLALAAQGLVGCGSASPSRASIATPRPTPDLANFPAPPERDAPPWYHDTPLDKPPTMAADLPACPDGWATVPAHLRAALVRCYHTMLAIDPAAEGKIVVEVEPNETSAFESVTVVASTIPTVVEACVLVAFADERHEPSKDRCRSRFTLPVIFRVQR